MKKDSRDEKLLFVLNDRSSALVGNADDENDKSEDQSLFSQSSSCENVRKIEVEIWRREVTISCFFDK